jgi:hypothetical protein
MERSVSGRQTRVGSLLVEHAAVRLAMERRTAMPKQMSARQLNHSRLRFARAHAYIARHRPELLAAGAAGSRSEARRREDAH